MGEETTLECPRCGSAKVLRISYGLPLPRDPKDPPRVDFIEGGCIISDYSPTQGCAECGEQWGQRRPTTEFNADFTFRVTPPPTP